MAGATGIKHIAMAVSDVDAALAGYQRLLGVGFDARRYELGKAGSREAHFNIGDVEFQLCQSVDADGRFNDYIRAHGQGVHHICFTVDDVNATVAGAVAGGATLKRCKSCDVVGVHEHPEGWIAFVERDEVPGLEVEYMQVYRDGEMPERFRRPADRAV